MLLLILLSLLCIISWARTIANVITTPSLPSPEHKADPAPLVSVLIPARDEAARIGPCLAGLAEQTTCPTELIVVDDHSTDSTRAVVASYADRLPMLHILTSAPLPMGWAGKCWACWQAATHAQGDWLLFLDADIIPHPNLLAALLAHAERQKLDLLTLMPLLRLGSPIERMVLPAFMNLLYGLYPLKRVNNPRSPIAFANGQCLLIRRSAYIALDGHRAVRHSVLEDTDLGQLAKANAYRLAALAAPDLIDVRMYTNWAELSEGLTKNAVAGYRSGGLRSAWVGAEHAVIALLPWWLMGAYGVWAMAWHDPPNVLITWGAGLALGHAICSAWVVQRRYRIAGGWGILTPLGLAIYFGLAGRAFLRLRSGRGVVWKGRTFSS